MYSLAKPCRPGVAVGKPSRPHPNSHQFEGRHTYRTTRHNASHISITRKSSLRTREDERQEQVASPIIQIIVGAATEALRLVQNLAGQGAAPETSAEDVSSIDYLPVGDVAGVMEGIRQDFEAAYFVTGVLTDAIYDETTYFADPTVKFTGRELWKRNLQLLVPFLIHPTIELYSLTQVDDASPPPLDASGSIQGRGAVLRAEWRLATGLKLPWRPYIDVKGDTTYTLHWPDNNRIVKHVEAWDIDGVEALRLVLSPGRKKLDS